MMKIGCDFDELLFEAWERCTDKPLQICGPSTYGRLRRWLSRLTAEGRRGETELAQLECVVCALRAEDENCLLELLNGVLCEPELEPCVERRDVVALLCEDDCKMLRAALETVDGCTELNQFFRDVASLTCDSGVLLMRVTGDVLADFRTFVNSVFGNRVTQIGMVLAREQALIRDRFADIESRTLNRAQLALTFVQDVLPDFDWVRYATEPGYMKRMVVSRCLQAEESDADDLRVKGLLYQLNWLRSEIDRADCENHGLNEQLAALVAELATVNRKIAEEHCSAASEMAGLSDELDCLRNKSADQVATIDNLLERIQIIMGNATADKTISKCPRPPVS